MEFKLDEWILTLLLAAPVAGALVVALLPGSSSKQDDAGRMRRVALGFSAAAFGLALIALLQFLQAENKSKHSLAERGEYALIMNVSWVTDAEGGNQAEPSGGYIDLRYHVGVDGLSVWLVMLTAAICPLAIWASFTSIRERVREYYLLMLLLEAGMIGVFCARDLLLFYVFFEFTLIPLFFIIGIWGGPERRRAAVKFFIYTIAGSVLTFAGVLFLAYQAYQAKNVFTFDLDTLYELELSTAAQWWLFIAFAAGFAVKVPLFPFHTWLPLAHTEAPTAGSVLLAGVLLKLGTYGFLRFSLPMLPAATQTFAPIMAGLAVVGIIYAALVAWVQDDVKKLIAYSSVSHLGFCMLGMFSLKTAGVTGSVMYMLNHGLSTGALFLVIGMIYERYHTRRFDDLGGLARPMPWMAFFLIVFTLSSIGLPGLNGFVGEFLVLLGTFTSAQTEWLPLALNPRGAGHAGPLGVTYAVLAATGIVLGAIYMLHMCGRVLFGPVKEPAGTPDRSQGLTPDLTPREIGILAPLAVVCLVLGVYPRAVLDTIQPAAEQQILRRVFDQPVELIDVPTAMAEVTTGDKTEWARAVSAPPMSQVGWHGPAIGWHRPAIEWEGFAIGWHRPAIEWEGFAIGWHGSAKHESAMQPRGDGALSIRGETISPRADRMSVERGSEGTVSSPVNHRRDAGATKAGNHRRDAGATKEGLTAEAAGATEEGDGITAGIAAGMRVAQGLDVARGMRETDGIREEAR